MKPILIFFLLISILFATSTTLIAQTLTSNEPNSAKQGQSLPVDITGVNSIFTQGSCTGPGILTSITPDTARQSQTLTVIITGIDTGFGTTFTQGFSAVTDAWLSQGSSTIDGGWWFLYDTLFFSRFYVPADANVGKWDLNVTTTCDETITLSEGFTITPPCAQPGDLTCDGIVNFLDFAVSANHWLEGTGP